MGTRQHHLLLVLGCFFALLATCMVAIHLTSGPTELVARRFPKMAASESGAGLGLGVAKPGNPAAQRRGAVTHVGLGLGIERPEGGLHKAVAGKGKSLPDFVVSGGGSGVAVSQGGDHVSAPLGWPEKIAALAVAAAEGHGQEGVEEDPAEEGQEQVEEDVEKENEGGGDAAEGEHGEKEEEEEKRGEEEASEVAEKKGGGVSYNPYGFLAGDPILNQNLQSSRYVDPCERTMNCPTAEDEEKNAKWRSIKQHRMDASELMERQLVQLLLKAQRGAEECEQGFPDDEAKMAKCTQDHLQRACDRYADVKHTCNWSEAQSKEMHEALTLKVCEGDAKKAMEEMCPMFTKLPGVSVTHWPWQDFNMNMGARSFSVDALLAGGMHQSADYR